MDYLKAHYRLTAMGYMQSAKRASHRRIGASKLPGKYAFGGIYFGLENKSFFGETYDGRYALYWQADQMLFREPRAPERKIPRSRWQERREQKGCQDPCARLPSWETGGLRFEFPKFRAKV